jgi:hypothetical protein
MGGTGVILSTNIPLRNDGLPYANSREPNDPGVAVYFRYQKRDLCFACDAYTSVRENAYAIAKTVEALRGIERWGASGTVSTRTIHELWDRQDAREALSLPVSLEDRILIALRLSRYAGCADHWQVRFCAAAALTRATGQAQ